MEKPQLQLISTAAYVPVSGETTTPCSPQAVVLTKQDDLALKWEANYWRTQHARLVQREAALKAHVEALAAPIRDLTQRLDGTNSEQSAASEALGKVNAVQPRKRGQQPGTPGHGRSDRSTLPVAVAVHDVSAAATHGPQWGEALAPFPGVEGGASIAVQVQAHIRRRQRPRSPTPCRCAQRPGMVTAPPVPRVIPQSPLGVSVWTMVWLDTDLYSRPPHRVCQELAHPGFPLSQGPSTDGLPRLKVLVEPLMPVRDARQMTDKRFHGADTRWAVCAESEGKTGPRWSLWVMPSASVVDEQMAPGRGADVPQRHCGQ